MHQCQKALNALHTSVWWKNAFTNHPGSKSCRCHRVNDKESL